MKAKILGFAIVTDPSLMGDKTKNDALRAESCPTCGYPKAQAGLACRDCSQKALAEQVEAALAFDAMLGFTGTAVHSFSQGRYLDSGNPDDKRFLDP